MATSSPVVACVDSAVYVALALGAQACVPPAVRDAAFSWLVIAMSGQLIVPAWYWYAPGALPVLLALASPLAFWAGAVVPVFILAIFIRTYVAAQLLDGAELVENAVLRDLEEPRRELRAQREAWQSLEHAEEDLLGQILSQGPVADEAKHIVEDRHLISAHDDRERALITALCLPQDAKIRLLK